MSKIDRMSQALLASWGQKGECAEQVPLLKRNDQRSMLLHTMMYTACVLVLCLASACAIIYIMDREPSGVKHSVNVCNDPCSVVLLESIPEGLHYPAPSPEHNSIFQTWLELLGSAKTSLDVASFYWTLRDSDLGLNFTSAWQINGNICIGLMHPAKHQGKQVFDKFLSLPSKGVAIQIATDGSKNSRKRSKKDVQDLENKGATVRAVDFDKLTTGVLHTKMWVVDLKHIYVGSANMDWRSLTQVKELGVVLYNCSCLARDVQKVFLEYWWLGQPGATIPKPWPEKFSTNINQENPLHVNLNGTPSTLFFTSSPHQLCPSGRTEDLTAIVTTINNANEFVYIAVMDYVAASLYGAHHKFWPMIDDALRHAALDRNVEVKLLTSCWPHTNLASFFFLQSLQALDGIFGHAHINTKFFITPASKEQQKIPYARVNHNKYMVTDKAAYIGTSNWSKDYFTNTAGVALVINQTASLGQGLTVQEQMRAVFLRDWNSPFTVAPSTLADLQRVCRHP
uniref:Phospholipase D family, member 7 n=1 Tax=Eptatretus burgeri TaxID=7764 RepID=A0A8C4QNV9_EPTBU